MEKHTLGKVLVAAFTSLVLGSLGYKYANNRKHEEYMLNLPPEYFTAEAEKARANADLEARKYEAKKKQELAEYQAKLDFEKNASPEYWNYKSAREERATRERIAKQESDTRKAQATELRRAFESYTK